MRFRDMIDKVICNDNLKIMPDIPDDTIDLIPTDPQYGWEFMGKDWDRALPPQKAYDECFRVLKPGAFLFWMSGARLDCFIENGIRIRNAGFEIGFTPLFWAYASGFPKAMNIGKVVDKRLGVKREVIGQIKRGDVEEAKTRGTTFTQAEANKNNKAIFGYGIENITKPATPQAKALDGSYAGFQPKPAVEVIIVAMKPLSEKTYVEQALKNRKGITWLDDGRIPYDKMPKNMVRNNRNTPSILEKGFEGSPLSIELNQKGRFPANLLVSDDVLNDGINHKSGKMSQNIKGRKWNVYGQMYDRYVETIGDSGSFSRFFDLDAWWQERIKKLPESVQKTFPFLIVPKASKSEKDRGLEVLKEEDRRFFRSHGGSGEPIGISKNYPDGRERPINKMKNIHPTVKPIELGCYLITLGSREGDIIFDPFGGTFTFCISAYLTHRHYISCEIERDSFDIGKARLNYFTSQLKVESFVGDGASNV